MQYGQPVRGIQSTGNVKVENQMQGTKELSFTLTGTAEQAPTDILIFPGSWRTATQRSTIKQYVTFSSSCFESYEQMVNYFQRISTNVFGIAIETSDLANFAVGQYLRFFEKDPAGDETPPVKVNLSKYRVPVGSSFSERMELSAKDIAGPNNPDGIVLWPGLDVMLKSLKGGSTMTFYLSVRGWSKSQELKALKGNII